MDQETIENALDGSTIGPVRFYESVASTNDLALAWGRQGAPDLALIVADEQTAGRGRSRRSWITPRGAALAFSLVLRPGPGEDVRAVLPRLGGIAGLSVVSACHSLYSLHPELKWPNDVLLRGKKVCGILTEVDWIGDQPQVVVVGIGVNVYSGSVPSPETVRFPATCLEAELGWRPDRLPILAAILHAFLDWRQKPADEVIRTWDALLAYRGMMVELSAQPGQAVQGRLEGLDINGTLRLRLPSGELASPPTGDLSLRLVDSPPE
jgi:BirA family biotin operon repressor/biotin-[acetyl-CoA-carboxylase] ligase